MQEKFYLYVDGKLYGTGPSEYMTELLDDYINTCKLYNKEQVMFEVLSRQEAFERYELTRFMRELEEEQSAAVNVLDLVAHLKIALKHAPEDAYSLAMEQLSEITSVEEAI